MEDDLVDQGDGSELLNAVDEMPLPAVGCVRLSLCPYILVRVRVRVIGCVTVRVNVCVCLSLMPVPSFEPPAVV